MTKEWTDAVAKDDALAKEAQKMELARAAKHEADYRLELKRQADADAQRKRKIKEECLEGSTSNRSLVVEDQADPLKSSISARPKPPDDLPRLLWLAVPPKKVHEKSTAGDEWRSWAFDSQLQREKDVARMKDQRTLEREVFEKSRLDRRIALARKQRTTEEEASRAWSARSEWYARKRADENARLNNVRARRAQRADWIHVNSPRRERPCELPPSVLTVQEVEAPLRRHVSRQQCVPEPPAPRPAIAPSNKTIKDLVAQHTLNMEEARRTEKEHRRVVQSEYAAALLEQARMRSSDVVDVVKPHAPRS